MNLRGSAKQGLECVECQLTLFGPADHPILDELRKVDLNQVPPMQALQLLGQWQESLKNEESGKRRKRS